LSVYLIAQIDIHDAEEYQKYLDGFFPIFKKYGGKFLASDPKTTVLEGEWAHPRTALMTFDSESEARNWYESTEYQQLAKHRHNAAATNFAIVRSNI
jgi:uncharacterized protein (DUF1330 family)